MSRLICPWYKNNIIIVSSNFIDDQHIFRSWPSPKAAHITYTKYHWRLNEVRCIFDKKESKGKEHNIWRWADHTEFYEKLFSCFQCNKKMHPQCNNEVIEQLIFSLGHMKVLQSKGTLLINGRKCGKSKGWNDKIFSVGVWRYFLPGQVGSE